MNPKKKKVADIIFSLAFVAIITIPLLCMNRAEYVESELENRVLTGWPGWGFNGEYNQWYGHYAEDRIGFREEAIVFFSKATHCLFHEFVEDMHMYGKEDYVFPADEGYIKSYQHLNTDENLVDSLAVYLENTNEYLKAKNIPFVFMVCLDKKSVYGEYFPDYIHVKKDETGTLELLKEKLDKAGVPYVIPVEEFREAAKTTQLYNRKYDSAHWNDLGALYGLKLVGEKFRQLGSSAPVLSEKDYQLSYVEMEYMEFVDIPIHEQVPYYTLLEKPELKTGESLIQALKKVEGTSIQHYKNPNAKSDETILIFHDSFLQSNKKFFVDIYKEVYLVSRQNYEGIQYYVNILQPDLVLYENAERAFADDLYAYTHLKDVRYEMPYEGTAVKEQENQEEVLLRITGTEGASISGDVLSFDKNSGVVVIKGELEADNPQNYNVYVKYKDQYYEADYEVAWREEAGSEQEEALTENQMDTAGKKDIYVPFRSTKMKKGTMEFIAVSKESGQEISLLLLQVKKAE